MNALNNVKNTSIKLKVGRHIKRQENVKNQSIETDLQMAYERIADKNIKEMYK